MTPKILEEYKNPGTYPTKINVQRTGQGFFVQVVKKLLMLLISLILLFVIDAK